jgi:hypothetical protein
MMSRENRLMMEEQEDNHVKEEAFNEDFDHPPHGTVHRLSFLFVGLCPAGEQEIVLGHGRYSHCLFRRPVYGL